MEICNFNKILIICKNDRITSSLSSITKTKIDKNNLWFSGDEFKDKPNCMYCLIFISNEKKKKTLRVVHNDLILVVTK